MPLGSGFPLRALLQGDDIGGRCEALSFDLYMELQPSEDACFMRVFCRAEMKEESNAALSAGPL
jgi:hypothetical protein